MHIVHIACNHSGLGVKQQMTSQGKFTTMTAALIPLAPHKYFGFSHKMHCTVLTPYKKFNSPYDLNYMNHGNNYEKY